MILQTNYKMKPPPSAKPIRSHLLSREFIGFWLMNERGGSIHNIAQNYNHETSRVDVTWAAGKFGQCNSFPGGVGDYINCGAVDEQLKLLSTDFTLLIGGYADAVDGDKIFFGASEADNDGWMWGNHDGLLAIWMDGSWQKSTNTIIAVGEWRLYAITFRASDRQTKFYYNGILDATETHPKFPVDTVGRNFVIGIDPRDYSGKAWDGLLDMPIVCRRLLSQFEIAQLYQEPFCMFGRKRQPVITAAGPPPEVACQWSSLTTNLWWLKHNKGLFTKL